LRLLRDKRRLGLLLLAVFGLGGAVGYAAGAQRSLLGLTFLAGLLAGLALVEWLLRQRQAALQDEEPRPRSERGLLERGGRPYDLARDRSTKKQRYLM